MRLQKVVLASGSEWRLRLLHEAGVPCEAVSPGTVEDAVVETDPMKRAVGRATAKALAVASGRPDALVIGADQVVHLDGQLFGKPRDDAHWREMLGALVGKTHSLTTGVALVGEGINEAFHVTTTVTFRADLTDDELRAYVASGEARSCAGGYMVERRGAWLVARIDGDWNNVIGLPIGAVIARLRAAGWRLDAVLAAPPLHTVPLEPGPLAAPS
jgi:septum formation protein